MKRRFGVSMDDEILKKFDAFIKKRNFPNRSEAITYLVKDAIINDFISREDERFYGVILIMYNHEKKGINDDLVDVQHKYTKIIRSSIHIHIDEKNCFESIIVDGKGREIQKLADSIKKINGVESVRFLLTKLI